MWDDFQIGDRVVTHTAIKVNLMNNLSYNDFEYWWHSSELNLGGRINRKSKVGRRLDEMVIANDSQQEIELYILQNALAHINVDAFIKMLKFVKDKAYQDGLDAKAAEICACLGL